MTQRLGFAAASSAVFIAAGVMLAAGGATIPLGVVAAVALAGAVLTRPTQATPIAIGGTLLIPPVVRLSTSGPDVTPQRLMLLLMLVALAMTVPRPTLPRRIVLAGSFFAAYLFVLAVVNNHAGGTNRVIGYTVESFLPLLVVAWACRDRITILKTVDTLIVAMAVASLLAIYEGVTGRYLIGADGDFFFHAPERVGHLRVQGVFPHSLMLGVAIVVVLPLAISRGLTGRRFAWISSALMTLALFLTYGRGPWLAAIVSVLLLAGMLRGGKRAVVVAAMITTALAVSASPWGGTSGTLLKAITNPVAQQNGGFTVSYRQQLWNATEQYVTSHPFGTGPGGTQDLALYGYVAGRVSDLSASVDNAYAKVLLEFGWPGLILFGLLLLGAVRTALVARQRWSEDPELGPVSAALAAGIIGFVVVSTTVATFTIAQLLLLFWSCVGLSIALSRELD